MNTRKYLIPLVMSFFILMPTVISVSMATNQMSSMSVVYTNSVTPLSSDGFYGENDEGESVSKAQAALGEILVKGQVIFNGLIGLGLLSSVAAFVFTAFKLGKSGDSKGRSEAINNLIGVCITTACLGGFPLIYSLIISLII